MTERNRHDLIQRYLPAVMLVTDSAHLRGRRLDDVVGAAITGGVNMVQLREKTATRDELTAIIRTLREVIRGRAPLFVNSPHIGDLNEGGDGMHVPEHSSVGVRDLRSFDCFISAAVHSAEAAVRAEADGADMLVLGTVFPSTSHPGGPTIGLDGVREACVAVRVPVIGIGGITAENAGDVIRAGASGVAVISAIFDAPDSRAAAAVLRRAVDEAAR